MFEQLFGSKTRVKLLSLFYNNPDRPFYVREITRKIDEQINSVRRELQNLLNIGIVRSVSQSNRLYYEVNAKYKFHKELQSIFQRIPAKSKEIKQTKEEDHIFKGLQKAGNVRMAFLTGAFVRGSHQQIDIFIVGDMNKSQLAKIVGDMEKEMNRELNYASMTIEDFDYRRNLNDRFLTDILDENKIVLVDKIGVFAKTAVNDNKDQTETTTVSVMPKAESEEETPVDDKSL
ncbi:MAG: winged helix-turn-helix domain-containing protein [bacterium]